MSIIDRFVGRVPVPDIAANSIRAAADIYDDMQALAAAMQSAQSRIDRGLYDHFHHPVVQSGERTVDVLLDMTNGLVKALQETRQRLEDGLVRVAIDQTEEP